MSGKKAIPSGRDRPVRQDRQGQAKLKRVLELYSYTYTASDHFTYLNMASANRFETKTQAKPRAPTVFHCKEMSARLSALKQANPQGDWWAPAGQKPAIRFDWDGLNDKKVTKWVNAYYTDSTGVSGPIVFKFGSVQANGTDHEVHTGRIEPNSDQAVAEVNSGIADPKFHVKKRPGAPGLKVMLYADRVKTEADGYTLLTDEQGKPILPADDKRSPLYMTVALVGEAFAAECGVRIARGQAIVEAAVASTSDPRTGIVKYTRRDGVTAAAVAQSNPAKGAFMSPDQLAILQKAYPSKGNADVALMTTGAIVNNLKISPTVREVFGGTSANKGQSRPNPVVDINLKHNEAGIFNNKIYDMKSLSYVGGRPSYEELKVGGVPVNADNIHLAIESRSEVDGIAKMDSVCFSQVCISMPREAIMLFVKRPDVVVRSDFESMYSDLSLEDGAALADASQPADGGSQAAGPGAANRPTRAAGGAAAAEAVDNSYDDLLAEMGADE